MIRAALFDVDGTLVDSNDLHAAAWQEAFCAFGVDLPFDVVRGQIGKGGDNLVPTLLPGGLAERSKEIQKFRSDLFRADFLPLARPFPGIRPLFERLHGDSIRIILATSAQQAELDHHLDLIGCRDLVFATTSKDDVEHSKPCPDIFEAALDRAEAAPDEAVVVGDSPWDMKAAAKIGLKAVAVRCGGFPDAELEPAGAAAIFDHPVDLLRRYPDWTT